MTRIIIAILVGLAAPTVGTYVGSMIGLAATVALGFSALALYVWLDLRRGLPPATRRELDTAHRLNRLDLRGALRRNERTT